VLLVPAAFTLRTGLAHWLVLLRARAMYTYLSFQLFPHSLSNHYLLHSENQCYVVASAQTGVHNTGEAKVFQIASF
jgi:predicted amidohydrolase